MSLERVTTDKILGRLPTPVALRPTDLLPIDLFVAALGFEDRCAGAAYDLSEANVPIARALIAVYPRNVDDNERRRPELEGALRHCGAQTSWAPIAEGEYYEALRQSLSEGPPPASFHVCVDISCMSAGLILSTLRTLSSLPQVTVSILYTEALDYGPTHEQYENDRRLHPQDGVPGVDYGVGSIRFSVDFQGTQTPGLSDLLLVIPGFGRDRVRAAISYVNPAYLVAPNGHVKWILGQPRREGDEWRAAALRQLHGVGDGDVAGEVNDFDYRRTVECLDRIFTQSEFGANVTIAPFGTKLQSVGVAIHCLMRPAVRVLVVDPEYYSAHEYSHGTGPTWVIDLGRVDELLGLLRSVDRLEVPGAD